MHLSHGGPLLHECSNHEYDLNAPPNKKILNAPLHISPTFYTGTIKFYKSVQTCVSSTLRETHRCHKILIVINKKLWTKAVEKIL